MEKLRFLNEAHVRGIRGEYGTPAYVYDEETLRAHGYNRADLERRARYSL